MRHNLWSLAEKSWRAPLGLAVVLFAASGPAHALGRTDAVFYAVLVATGLATVAVPIGLLSLRYGKPHTDREERPS